MEQQTQEFIELLKREIDLWEHQARFWEDPRVIGLEDISGSRKTSVEMAQECRARAQEHRDLIMRLSS